MSRQVALVCKSLKAAGGSMMLSGCAFRRSHHFAATQYLPVSQSLTRGHVGPSKGKRVCSSVLSCTSSRELSSLAPLKHAISTCSPATISPAAGAAFLNASSNWERFLCSRGFLSAVSMTGFNDYEIGRRDFEIDVPEYFNFASDVMDDWTTKEESGERTSSIPAFWWVDTHGNEVKWSFKDLTDKSKKVANLLQASCDIRPGDRVMVILHRIPEWWLLNLACMRLGAVLVPGSTQLRQSDIRHRLQSSESICIITDDEIASIVDQVAPECETLQTKIVLSQKAEKRKDQRSGWLNYYELYEEASMEHECVKTRSHHPMLVFFTSGTTGKPKMAQHTHASYGLGHVITGKYWLDLSPMDVMWNMSDTGWAKSAYSNVFAPWIQGSCVFIENSPKFDPKHTLQVLSDYPVSVFCAPPTAYTLMCIEEDAMFDMRSVRDFLSGGEHLVLHDYPISVFCAPPTAYTLLCIQEDKFDMRSVRDFVTAGEHLNAEVNEAWRKKTGSYIREGYGQTETVLLTGMFRCVKNRPGSCGKVAPGFDLAIVDEEGNELPRGEIGIIGVRVKPEKPVGFFTEYVDDPERTAAAFQGDFYLTGDKASLDEDGYFWMIGRSDDVIISAGYRIGPYEVESALLEHPAVVEAAAVSSPDTTRGEVVKAFVVLAQDYQDGDKSSLVVELQNHVKRITAPYKYPRRIEFTSALPKTVSGKIRRVELREQEWSKQPKATKPR